MGCSTNNKMAQECHAASEYARELARRGTYVGQKMVSSRMKMGDVGSSSVYAPAVWVTAQPSNSSTISIHRLN